MIYVLKCQETGRVKIGKSENVRERVSDIQTSSPTKLDVVCVVEGGLVREAYLHQLYSQYHVRGEWFDLPEKVPL